VIVGIVCAAEFGWTAADPLVGLAIAAVIAHTAWEVFQLSYDQLMDHELPEEDRARIRAILLAHADIHAIHDLRTRSAGMQSFIQVHIELDPSLSLRRAHDISDEAEGQIRAVFPQAEIIIHQDLKGYEKPAVLAQS
jgi:ferrous-iron efflux pump FieF